MLYKTHKFEDLFPGDFRDEFEKTPVIYCAFGGVEYHGPQSTLGSDYIKGHEICLRTAEITGGIVHPTVPIAPGGAYPSWSYDEMRKFNFNEYPAVFGSNDICRSLYIDLLKFFSECLNFKVCVTFGAHGPAADLLKAISEQFNGIIAKMRLIVVNSYELVWDLIEKEAEKLGIVPGGHGGMWENSIYMACRDGSINLDELENQDKRFKGLDPKNREKLIKANRKSNREFGKLLINTYSERLAVMVQEALDAS